MRDRWFGGRDGGYHYECSEWTPVDSWSFDSTAYPGLHLHVFGYHVRGQRRLRARCFSVRYQLGGRAWIYGGKCDSVACAKRRALAVFERDIREAWRVAWEKIVRVYRWDRDAKSWEHIASSTHANLEESYDYGFYVMVRDGDRPWYMERYYLGASWSTSPPREVTAIDSAAEAA